MGNMITMKFHLFIFALLMLGFHPTSSAQSGGESVKLLAIRNHDDFKAIPYSSIANRRTSLCFQSDFNGHLKINVASGDTLLFKCMGYRDTTLVVTPLLLQQDSLVLKAQLQPHMLKDVDVFAFYSYASFKHRFANLKLEPDKKAPIAINFDINIKEIKALAKANGGSAISIGLGGLYGKTNQQKYAEFLAKEEKMARVKSLTSHEDIMAFTGLSGETLDSFMVFLRARYEFEPSQSDYDIMAAVQTAFDAFLALKSEK